MKIIAACLALALLWGCGSDGNRASAPASPSGAPSIVSSTVRLALDWTPNTNHTGFYVARAKGWYAAAGIDLQVLPYATATPETLLAAHQAECGISFQDSLTFAVAAGADIVSVAAILQRTASAIGVLADGPIERPRDLDGKTYAGFGYPNELPTLKAVIQADGGTGEFDVATLDSAAYEALYNKKADFTIPFTAWEGVEADLRGIDLRYFRFADYGFPEFYQVVLACDRAVARARPGRRQTVRRCDRQGLRVRRRGSRTPPPTSSSPRTPGSSTRTPICRERASGSWSTGGYLVDEDGRVRPADARAMARTIRSSSSTRASWLMPTGILLTRLDYAALFTNDFLP